MAVRGKRKAELSVPQTSGAQSGEARQPSQGRMPESQGRGGKNQGDLWVAGSLDKMSNGGGKLGLKTQFFIVKSRTKE